MKQGCSLSPLLFVLYISGVGTSVNAENLGVQCGTVNISILLFADDVILVTDKGELAMATLLRTTENLFKKLGLTLAEKKCFSLSQNDPPPGWTVNNQSIKNKAHEKYLGITIHMGTRRVLDLHKAKMLGKASFLKYQIIYSARSEIDRVRVGHALWEMVAIPSIMYWAGAINVSEGTMKELELIQNTVARFITGNPRCTATAGCLIDAKGMSLLEHDKIKRPHKRGTFNGHGTRR